jgi:hypothetical protein
MEDSEYYRQRAELYLRSSRKCTVLEIANALRVLAADYLDYAREIDSSRPDAPAAATNAAQEGQVDRRLGSRD